MRIDLRPHGPASIAEAVGTRFSLKRPIRMESVQSHPTGSEMIITFPYLVSGDSSEQIRRTLGRAGFDRFFVGGVIRPLDQWRSEDPSIR